jgi:hypothetical protein
MKIKFASLSDEARETLYASMGAGATNFAALSDEERAIQFATMDDDAIEAAMTAQKAQATALFAREPGDLTIADADDAEALIASMGALEAEQKARTTAATEAAERFAKARATFGVEDADGTDEVDEADEADAEEDESEEDESEEGDEGTDDGDADAGDGEGDALTAAAIAARGRRLPTSAAKKVGSQTKRPARKSSTDVVITAAADVPEFSTGQRLSGMAEVAQAVMNRVKGFPKFNSRAAEQAAEQSGGQPVLHKFGAAAFGAQFDASLTASRSAEKDHDVVKTAVTAHVDRVKASLSSDPTVVTAAMAWCSPSEVVYNWIADYVVDGLLDLPEVAAPRGGLVMTEGPQLAQTTYGTPEAVDAFGFGGTEAEMEAGYVKTCETIECPEFVDHRLDFDGYCWKIPILTEATFPELVADAFRLSDVLYAHKMNRRFIRDVLAQSTAVNATNALGGSMLDTLEAFTQVAIKERRWWNLGENAVMEVKLPQEARHIFKMDMARRSGLALTDVANDAKVAAHFASYNLAVTYISDFDQRYGAATPTADWPETIRGIMYPAGTFLKSVKPVINLSAVYDAASLSENEYTGVFFEQGVMTIKRGYRSHVIEVPVCVAGATGANVFDCGGFTDPSFNGSF